MKSKYKQGFSLLEVLIAIVVFAFGLLALASLQLIGLASNQSATTRSLAMNLAYDLTDRMRANSIGLGAGNYNMSAGAVAADNACRAEHYSSVNAQPLTSCTPAQLAADDLFDWNAEIGGAASQLPGGGGIVCIDDGTVSSHGLPGGGACNGTGSVYLIKIWWTDKWADRTLPSVRRVVTIPFQP